MTKENFSIELKNILNYAQDTISKEIPSKKLSIEYLIMAIIDNHSSYAYALLENTLTSNSMNELWKFLASSIHNKNKEKISNLQTKPEFDEEIESILDKSEEEADKLKDKIVSSEHLLLSILKNNKKIATVFDEFGITYDIIFNICQERKNTNKNKKSNNTSKQKVNGIKTLKSSIGQNQNIIDNSSNNAKNQKIMPKPIILPSLPNLQGNEQTSFINQYTKNISIQTTLDGCKFIGREKELKEIITVLSCKNKNNVLIMGESGCGKTKICYKLADMINKGDVPTWLQGKEIVMLDVMALISGTSLRGMFEQRVNGLFNELIEEGNLILLIDNMEQVLRTPGKDKDCDLSGMLNTILNSDDVCVIGTLTYKDYKNGIENNPSLSSKFQTVQLNENTEEEAIEILNVVKEEYENYHNVRFDNDIIKHIVELSHKYIKNKVLPDSAIDILDVCGASTVFTEKFPKPLLALRDKYKDLCKKSDLALSEYELEKWSDLEDEKEKISVQINKQIAKYSKNKEKYSTEITRDIVDSVISNLTNIPVSKLNLTEKEKMLHINDKLKESIIGQDEAIDIICRSIKRNSIGLANENKPINVSLLIGPTGTGKTLLAKKIAQEVFGDENNLIRIDMSEFSEKSSVSKLIGTNQGYIGYGDTNMLTDKVKTKPYCVILLDEIEKANEEVYNLLLQVFDEGRLTDGQGVTVSFKKTIILMTSNIGAKASDEFGNGIGFTTDEISNKSAIIEKSLKKKFNPEFLNRIDSIVHFNSLTNDNIKKIINLELNYLNNRLNKNNLSIEINDALIDMIYEKAVSEKKFGARPIKRIITNEIEDKIVDTILENDLDNNIFVFDEVTKNLTYK